MVKLLRQSKAEAGIFSVRSLIENLPLTVSASARIAVKVGNIYIGGEGNKVIVQAMTDTPTADINKTVTQIVDLVAAGAEIVRITVNDMAAARAVPIIKNKLLDVHGCDVPIVGCFHYNGHLLLSEVRECAAALDKYRINPGNVGFGEKKDKQFEAIIKKAIEYNKPIRIGVNWGSIDKDVLTNLMDLNATNGSPLSSKDVLREAVVQSALLSAIKAEEYGLARNKIVLSAKVSNVSDLIYVYQQLYKRSHYALHLGLTEAGMGVKGTVSTAVALGILLQSGIGDTIRASITPGPGASRTEEVKVCWEVLQSLGLRYRVPVITACPGCGRTSSNYFQILASEIQSMVEHICTKEYPGIEELKGLHVAVMGCIVNGPGESKYADIGISLPGTGEDPVAVVFIDGVKAHTLRGNIAAEFKEILHSYIKRKYVKSIEKQSERVSKGLY